jgi:hypothetical protein
MILKRMAIKTVAVITIFVLSTLFFGLIRFTDPWVWGGFITVLFSATILRRF